MKPAVSVVVVAYDMARELPRTIRSLSPPYQTGVAAPDVEVIVVDNGSPSAVDPAWFADLAIDVRVVRIDPAPPSPARAANLGFAEAQGDLVGLIVDGARLASPGLLSAAVTAARVDPRAVVATVAYHLGRRRHMEAAESGHDQATEDALLDSIAWEHNGYELFSVSTLAGSSGRGWFGPLGESSALFMASRLWSELGGLDEAFALPGGGLVNHDLYRRACAADGATLVHLLGEGTFHQYHGGAATSRRYTFDEMQDDYERIRGERYRPPEDEPIYVGSVPEAARPHLSESVELAAKRRRRQPDERRERQGLPR